MKLTQAQWSAVEPLIPKEERTQKTSGRWWICPRKVLDGVLWILKTGARWKDLPKTYPSYQTCHRRFQKWVSLGIFENIIRGLVQDLDKRGKVNLSETFIDATFVDAQKGDLVWEKPSAAMAPRSWQSQTINLFLSPLALRVLHDMRVSLLKKQFGPVIQITYLRELWVTKHTILINSTGMYDNAIASKLLLPIGKIEGEKKLKMDGLCADINEDGRLRDSFHGCLHLEESKSDMTIEQAII